MIKNLDKILDLAIEKKVSDVHFQSGKTPIVRINSKLSSLDGIGPIEIKESAAELKSLLNEKQLNYFLENGSVDFAIARKDTFRFRGNIYRQENGISMNLRLINNDVLGFEALNLPPIFKSIAEEYRQGFFLIVGPTGHGKSTSLAAILSHINKTREKHIITIEDPIEYLIQNQKSIIDQREIGTHAPSFQSALRSCMRQDPDVIIIGEMRDQETMQAAITLAETGHLVLSTMHTNNSVQTIDRIIDTFPESKQKQLRGQLASALTGIISQRLVPGVDEKLVLAYEQLMVNDAVRNIIRSEKTEQLYNALQGGDDGGYVHIEKCLSDLVKENKITEEEAKSFSLNQELANVFSSY